jgi:hypothetical protein
VHLLDMKSGIINNADMVADRRAVNITIGGLYDARVSFQAGGHVTPYYKILLYPSEAVFSNVRGEAVHLSMPFLVGAWVHAPLLCTQLFYGTGSDYVWVSPRKVEAH